MTALPAPANVSQYDRRWSSRRRVGPRSRICRLRCGPALARVFCLAAVMAVVQFSRPPIACRTVAESSAPSAPPRSPRPRPRAAARGNRRARHHALRAARRRRCRGVAARRGARCLSCRPAALPTSPPVQALSLVAQHGLVEIRLADGGSGFIDADAAGAGRSRGGAAGLLRLQRRATAAERRGARSPRRRHGAARRSATAAAQPAVVKLRDADGPGRRQRLSWRPAATRPWRNLPDAAYRPDFAVGELWSRACDAFAAGMRAQRFAGYASPSGAVAAGDPAGPFRQLRAPVDIPDAAFEQE